MVAAKRRRRSWSPGRARTRRFFFCVDAFDVFEAASSSVSLGRFVPLGTGPLDRSRTDTLSDNLVRSKLPPPGDGSSSIQSWTSSVDEDDEISSWPRARALIRSFVVLLRAICSKPDFLQRFLRAFKSRS